MTFITTVGCEDNIDDIQEQIFRSSSTNFIPRKERYIEIDPFFQASTSIYSNWFLYNLFKELDMRLLQSEFSGQTTTDYPSNIDDILKLLKSSKARSDEDLVTLVKSIDWTNKSADDYLEVVKIAITSGNHIIAYNFAVKGAEQFPNNAKLKNFSRILAPPKILPISAPAQPGLLLNRDWLIENQEEYQGYWVALKEGELLGKDNTLKGLIKLIGNPKGKGILVTRV
jgi:hypothetical protein